MEYRITDIEFTKDENGEREVHVTLNNGTIVKIYACYESWAQYNGTTPELSATVDVAERVNDWLHGGEIPDNYEELIDDEERQVKIHITCDKGYVSEFLRRLADELEDEDTEVTYIERYFGDAEIEW